MKKHVCVETHEKMLRDDANLKEKMFAFAKKRAEDRKGMGWQETMPTVRELAEKFRHRQQEVLDAIEDMRDSGFPVDLVVGLQNYNGFREYEKIGDYRMEVYED